MKMHRLIFAAAVLLALCGCAAQNTEPIAGTTESTLKVSDGASSHMEEAVSDDLIVVGFSQIGSESDWRLTNTASFKSVFTEDHGYYLIFADGQQKQENQMKAIRDFILQEVDYIVLDPVVETGWDSVLEEAKKAGIPVIISDRSVSVADDSLYTCWIGSDFHAEGVAAGHWLEQTLSRLDRKDAPINIVTLQGTLGSTAQIGRTEGFAEVVADHENWNILEQQDSDFTQAKAQEVMAYYLDTYPDIDVIVSENDNMTFGVLEALENAKISLSGTERPIIISFDAVKDALQAVDRGEIDVDFECNPLTAPYINETILKLEAGKSVERIQYVDEAYFDTSMDLEQLIKEREY